MKNFIAFILFAFLGQYSYGQDSLHLKLSKENPDTTRLKAISELAVSYIGKNNDSSYF